MKRTLALLALPVVLASCAGGTNPFTPDPVVDEDVDPADPNVSVNSKFLFNVQDKLVLNSVDYDEDTDELVINNLPFDGPDQRYSRIGGRNGAQFYASTKTPTTGRVQSYAVYVKRDALEAAAAGGAEWVDFGFGGANVNRESYGRPASGEYVYTGVYAAVRTMETRGGLHLVTGDARMLVDIDDLDPNNGVQGTITGNVTNRQRTLPDGTPLDDLPVLFLDTVSFDIANGTFEGGNTVTTDPFGEVRASGRYEGMFAGTEGEELGAITITEGVAEIQLVNFEVVEYEYPDPDTGATLTGTYAALNRDNSDAIQRQVEAGVPVDFLTVENDDLPDGAVVLSTEVEQQEFRSDFNAREVGVIGTDQVIP